MKSIILTGGGTAGHIMPNLALLPEIEKYFDKIYYLGGSNSMEQKIISEYKNIEFIEIPTTKLVRKITLKNLAIPFKLINSIHKTKKIIKRISPNVIFCKGGFVSVPVAIAGKICKVPVVSHESDLSMGLANKVILRFAKRVCTTFKDTAIISKKCVVTGTPIRKQIFSGKPERVKNKFSYDKNKPFILFFGGSLGSQFINNLVKTSLNELCKNYNVLHITGKGNKINLQSLQSDIAKQNNKAHNDIKNNKTDNKLNAQEFKFDNYYQIEFTNSIQDYFACSDIVICRGGANSLFELLALKKPTLIIPLSKAQSRGDQIENAVYFKKHYLSEVLQEENANTNSLLEKINKLNKNKQNILFTLCENKIDSNKKIVDIIVKNAKN